MNRLHPFTAQLGARRDLSDEQITAAAHGLADPEVPDIDKAMFLTALADKGETAAEVAAFAAAFRTMSVDPGMAAWAPRATLNPPASTVPLSTVEVFRKLRREWRTADSPEVDIVGSFKVG